MGFMQNISSVLTPDNIQLLTAVERTGSLASAARELGVVPSALTYRLRQMEDALDALLVTRSSRRSQLTPAGLELLRTGAPLLQELDAVARRVKRVATGWEPELVIISDALVSERVLLELCQAFYAQQAPTQLKLRQGTMAGTFESLVRGESDLALGVSGDTAHYAGVRTAPMGQVSFVFAVAPQHPLASVAEPLTDSLRAQHRAVAAADSSQHGGGLTVGLLPGQDVLTVPDMHTKLRAQLAGLGCGFLPLPMAQAHLDSGALVAKALQAPQRTARLAYAWRGQAPQHGLALKWWLNTLQQVHTREALLNTH
jgi:molybdate transport repressor ModE-like protein